MLCVLLTRACASSELSLSFGKTVQQSSLVGIAVGAARFRLLQQSPSGHCCWLAAAGSSRQLLLAVS